MLDKLEQVFVLHRRDYGETSLIVELFSRESGRVAVLSKGARGNKSKTSGILQPFMPLEASWRGKGELPYLRSAELAGEPFRFRSGVLVSALYLNELLMRVLQRHDPCEKIFDIYKQTLEQLNRSDVHQAALRIFEKYLLQELGYGLPLTHEANTHEPIKSEYSYRFSPELGFIKVASSLGQGNVFSGTTLLALARDDYSNAMVLRDAKRLIRIALMPLLGNHTIKTRELLQSV